MGERKNRSRSGAQTRCPDCGKKLRGEKGLATHLLQVHGKVLPKKTGKAA